MDRDILHQAGEHAEWNESFYFNFYDKEKDLCAFMRIGLKPNKDERSMFCFFMLPDGSIAGIKEQDRYKGELAVKGLQFKKSVPEKRWDITYSGVMGKIGAQVVPIRAAFALEFSALNDMFDYRQCVSGEKEKMSQSVASEHLEQFGSVKGTIRIGDREHEIDGLGERDHSWGIRDWNAPKMWIWLTCQFSDKCALNLTKLVVNEGEVDAGFMHIDGKSRPIVASKVSTRFNDDGSPASLDMRLTDSAGEKYHVSAEVLKKATLPFESPDGQVVSLMYETLARYTFDGQTGYGIAEYLVRKT